MRVSSNPNPNHDPNPYPRNPNPNLKPNLDPNPNLADGPRDVRHVEAGRPEGAVREGVLDEGGHEGVPG